MRKGTVLLSLALLFTACGHDAQAWEGDRVRSANECGYKTTDLRLKGHDTYMNYGDMWQFETPKRGVILVQSEAPGVVDCQGNHGPRYDGPG